MSLTPCVSVWGFFVSLPTSFVVPYAHTFFMNMSMNINNFGGTINYNDHHKEFTISGASTNVSEIVRSFFSEDSKPQNEEVEPEDVSPIDTSFFTSYPFSPEMIEKNLRQAISLASSKADVCRRLMALETQGYIILSNLTDERKAEVINPFAAPKFSLNAADFKKARNNPYRKKTS